MYRDPYWVKALDPDPHLTYGDPKHWYKQCHNKSNLKVGVHQVKHNNTVLASVEADGRSTCISNNSTQSAIRFHLQRNIAFIKCFPTRFEFGKTFLYNV